MVREHRCDRLHNRCLEVRSAQRHREPRPGPDRQAGHRVLRLPYDRIRRTHVGTHRRRNGDSLRTVPWPPAKRISKPRSPASRWTGRSSTRARFPDSNRPGCAEAATESRRRTMISMPWRCWNGPPHSARFPEPANRVEPMFQRDIRGTRMYDLPRSSPRRFRRGRFIRQVMPCVPTTQEHGIMGQCALRLPRIARAATCQRNA